MTEEFSDRPQQFFSSSRENIRIVDWDEFDKALAEWQPKQGIPDIRDTRDPEAYGNALLKLRKMFPELSLSEAQDALESLYDVHTEDGN